MNPQPADYKSAALPIELRQPAKDVSIPIQQFNGNIFLSQEKELAKKKAGSVLTQPYIQERSLRRNFLFQNTIGTIRTLSAFLKSNGKGPVYQMGKFSIGHVKK